MFEWINPNLAAEPGILRDPFIIKVGTTWYMVASPAPFWSGPVPGIPMWASDDLTQWRKVGLIIDRNQVGETAWYRDRLWAPEIHAADDGYYLTFNARNDTTAHKHSVALAYSETITGPYRILTPDRPLITLGQSQMHYDPALEKPDRYFANDATLFTDSDGRHYVAYSSDRGIHGQQVDLAQAATIGDEFLIHAPSTNGWDTRIEGPSLIRHGDSIYCFFSSFTRSYEVGVTVAHSMRGPWMPDIRNPLVGPAGPFKATGHNCVFEGPGGWWMAYHAESADFEGERLSIDPIDFAQNGRIETTAPTWTLQLR